jgi:hypothetical protein
MSVGSIGTVLCSRQIEKTVHQYLPLGGVMPLADVVSRDDGHGKWAGGTICRRRLAINLQAPQQPSPSHPPPLAACASCLSRHISSSSAPPISPAASHQSLRMFEVMRTKGGRKSQVDVLLHCAQAATWQLRPFLLRPYLCTLLVVRDKVFLPTTTQDLRFKDGHARHSAELQHAARFLFGAGEYLWAWYVPLPFVL